MYNVGEKIGWREGKIENGVASDWSCNGEIVAIGDLRTEQYVQNGVVIEEMKIQSYKIRDEKTGEVVDVDDWQLDDYHGGR